MHVWTVDHVPVKLDFSDAFSSIRRDEAVAANMPKIYRLIHAAHSCEPIPIPLGSLEFCEAIHPLLTSLLSTVRIGFTDG